ncbi:MAG: response regulator transcription factor [Oscillospiraceae bacterium]|nr:response regulator transcription factor [Oscillospiraceae bacterium]
MNNKDILIVDDDCDLAAITADLFTDNGYNVSVAADSRSALENLAQTAYRLILLDINLPDGTGFSLCETLRKTTDIPILFISARTSDTDKITGLDIGGDDYIPKPYSLGELLSRVKAHLRRSYAMDAGSERFCFGGVEVNLEARGAVKNGVSVELSAKEFDLLSFLLQNKNKALSKDDMFNAVWGAYSEAEPSSLTVHIRWLREKLEDDPSNPRFIKTVWGVGYKLEVI